MTAVVFSPALIGICIRQSVEVSQPVTKVKMNHILPRRKTFSSKANHNLRSSTRKK